MDVFCESVDNAPVAEDYASEDEFEGEERDVSFDTAITTGDIEITQNFSDQEDNYGLGVFDTHEEADPTETLQKVLQDSQSSDLPSRHIKQEPKEDEVRMKSEHLQSKDFSTSDDSHPVKPIESPEKRTKRQSRPGPASSKELHITRSGRKSTFIGMEKKKKSLKNESLPAKTNPPKKKKTIPRAEEDPVVERSECLVCSRPCSLTITKDALNHPFCFQCKRTYFSQRKTAIKAGESVNQRCSKKGRCKTNYNLQNQWCSACHLKKFENILGDLNVEFDFNTKTLIKRKTHLKGRVRFDAAGPVGTHNTDVMNDALENSSSVLLQRMSTKELADYGIEMENSIKVEPMSYDASVSHSSRASAASKRSLEVKEANPKARKYPKGPEQVPDVHTQTMQPITVRMRKNKEIIIEHSGGESNKVLNSNVPEICSESQKEEPRPVKKKSNRSKKNIMEYSSSDNEDSSYSLPEVNSGRDAVANSQSSKSTSVKSVTETRTSSANARMEQEEPATTENENNYTEVLESIKVYVFTCGHACGLCNSSASKEWLKDSGFYTAKPIMSSSSHKTPKPSTSKVPAPQKTCPLSSNAKNQSNNVGGEVRNYPSISAIPPNVLQNILESATSSRSKVQVKIVKKKTHVSKNDSSTALTTTVTNDTQKSTNSDNHIVTTAQVQPSANTSNNHINSSSTVVQSISTSMVDPSLVQIDQNTKPLVVQISSVQNDTSSVNRAPQMVMTTAAVHNVTNNVIYAPVNPGNSSVTEIQNVSNTLRVVPLITNSAAPVFQDVIETVPLQTVRIANTAATINNNITSPIISQILPSGNTPAPAINNVSELGSAQNASTGNSAVEYLPVQMTSASIHQLVEQGYVLTPLTKPSQQTLPIIPTTNADPVSQTTTNNQDFQTNR